MTSPVGSLALGDEGLSLDGAELAEVQLWQVAVPLLVAFGAAHGTEQVRQVVLIRVMAHDGSVGYGECDALSRPTYTHEYTSGAFALLRDEVVPALLAGAPLVHRFHPMARAGLHTALLDGGLRRARTSLVSFLGATRRRLERTAVLGLATSSGSGGGPGELLAAVAAALDGGATMVKLKVAGPSDLGTYLLVRQAFPGLDLAADANGSLAGLSGKDLVAAGLDRLGLRYLEQPYPADDLLASAALRRCCDTPVVLDESVTSLGGAQLAHAVGALDGLNVKPARLGGLGEAAALVAWAQEVGLPAFCGGMLELGVGRAAAAAVAALDGCCWPTDLGPSSAYVARDVTEPIVTDARGWLVVPDGVGLGVSLGPDEELVPWTRRHAVVVPRR